MQTAPALMLSLTFLVVVTAACSSPSSPGDTGEDVVSGVVLEIEDLTPVDGGITLTVRRADGAQEAWLIPSIFRFDVSEEDIALVAKAREIETGDRVWARGEDIEGGLIVQALFLSLEEVVASLGIPGA